MEVDERAARSLAVLREEDLLVATSQRVEARQSWLELMAVLDLESQLCIPACAGRRVVGVKDGRELGDQDRKNGGFVKTVSATIAIT